MVDLYVSVVLSATIYLGTATTAVLVLLRTIYTYLCTVPSPVRGSPCRYFADLMP